MKSSTSGRRLSRSVMRLLATFAVGTGLTLGLGVDPSFAATTTPASHSRVTAVARVAAAAVAPSGITAGPRASINPYGCGALATLGYKQMYVAAFAIGYCPSVFALQSTTWGRGFISWIDDGLCRVPWIVWAATGGRYTSCY